MTKKRQTRSGTENGFLMGQFLIAMPGMTDERFARAVIYVCAHNDDGAMGLVINQPQQMQFSDLLVHLEILDEREAARSATRGIIVRNGGPVERSRGFVLHSGDYKVDSSLPVSSDICLTATIDILRAISKGKGPRHAMMALGYAGWGAGQLENEIVQNGWLTAPAAVDLLFDADIGRTYDRILASLGVDLAHLSPTAGHA